MEIEFELDCKISDKYLNCEHSVFIRKQKTIAQSVAWLTTLYIPLSIPIPDFLKHRKVKYVFESNTIVDVIQKRIEFEYSQGPSVLFDQVCFVTNIKESKYGGLKIFLQLSGSAGLHSTAGRSDTLNVWSDLADQEVSRTYGPEHGHFDQSIWAI